MSFLPLLFKVEIVFPEIVCVKSVPSDSGNLCMSALPSLQDVAECYLAEVFNR